MCYSLFKASDFWGNGFLSQRVMFVFLWKCLIRIVIVCATKESNAIRGSVIWFLQKVPYGFPILRTVSIS